MRQVIKETMGLSQNSKNINAIYENHIYSFTKISQSINIIFTLFFNFSEAVPSNNLFSVLFHFA